MFKPEINISLFPKKARKSTSTSVPDEPTPDYVKLAEEAATRIAVKLVIGAVVVVASAAILKTAGDITTNMLSPHN